MAPAATAVAQMPFSALPELHAFPPEAADLACDIGTVQDVVGPNKAAVDAKPALQQQLVGVPHPSQAAAAPSRECFAAAGPVVATGHPMLQGKQVIDGNPDTSAPLAVNVRELPLVSDAFEGRMLLSVRGLPTSAAAARPGGPLACARRTFHVALQGRFRRPVMAEDLLSGQEFPKGPKMSASFMQFVFNGAAKVFANTTNVHVAEGKPHWFLFPVLAAAQLVNVSRPGEEPPLLEAEEDLRLWCPELSARGGGAPASADKRRRFFDVPSQLAGRAIGTDLVWTFHLHQSLIDFSTYKLGLPGVPVHLDLVPIVDTQPLQIMAKDGKSGEYLFNVLMWNERMLYSPDAASKPDEDALPGASKLKDRFKGLLSGW